MKGNTNTGNSKRNEGITLDLDFLRELRVNRSAVERRTATLVTRRSVKKEWQAAWLLKAVSCIDLTTLSGDDTEGRVKRLCVKALNPVRNDLIEKLGMAGHQLHTGAVCVYQNRIPEAIKMLKNSGVEVAAVSTGFPAGQIDTEQKIRQIERSVSLGATEIDIVISRPYVLTSNWKALYEEVKLFRQACGKAHMKTILATGELSTLTNVARAGFVCMMAGADFIKTSTGMESVNATLPVSLVMIRAIRDYYEMTGNKVGFKPAGGIRKAKEALNWLILIKEELGAEWMDPALFRFGASGLLGDIERQLEHFVTGSYSAANRHPLG